MIDRYGFTFLIKNYIIGFTFEDGFCFGKVSYLEIEIAKEIAKKLEAE